MSLSLTEPKARARDLVIQETGDELLVYNLKTNKAHCLNVTSAFVWSAFDGSNTISDIAASARKEFGRPVSQELIELAIDQLSENELLEEQAPQVQKSDRREWIKRVSLTSVIALPVIASLVAPPNALAAGSCACVNPGGCITQTSCPNPTNCNGVGVCAP